MGDTFYRFLTHPLNPALPESHHQNAAVITATVRAAGALAFAGYEVFLDGIFGPWFLPLISEELKDLPMDPTYVVLRVALHEALRRAKERDAALDDHVIRHMHQAFADLGWYERHVLETTQMASDEVVVQFGRIRPALVVARP